MIVNETETSATVVIRAALWARRSDLASIARDAGVSAEALHAFLNGSRLAPAVLETLTTRFWGGAFEYDAATDTMRSTNKTPPTTVHAVRLPPVINAVPPRSDGPPRILGDAPPPPPKKPAWLRG